MTPGYLVISSLQDHNGRLDKEAIVRAEALAGNDEFFKGCRAALDPMITYGVKKVEEKKGDGKGLAPATFWKTAEQLAHRELTGNAAQVAINHMRMNAKESEWNLWYRRILIKDLRCGVSQTTINNVVEKIKPNYAIPIFTCQLATDSTNFENLLVGEKILEVKLDGMRVITVVYPDGRVDQYSRNGKELLNFGIIKEQIAKHAKFFKQPMVLDGEVMSSSFQDLMKQAHRKSDVQTDDAVLNLFDILTLAEFQQGVGNDVQIGRSVALKSWYEPIAEHMPNVTIVGQEIVNLDTPEGKLRYTEINKQAVDGGYEGIMIKDPGAVYECKRARNWLKLKPFIEVSLTVTSVEEGTGKNEGRLGNLICEGVDDGKDIVVSVGSGFSDELRESIWADTQGTIGQVVEVRADAVTQNQNGTYSLRFPRFKSFRGFEAGEKL
jgi:DNA ligase-1